MLEIKSVWKTVAGPVVGLVVFAVFPEPGAIAQVAGIAAWMAFWWLTEAIKIYITALIPLVVFPLLGIMQMKEVAPLFMKDIIFLFIGGFLIAYGLERWNLHRRIALKIVLLTGSTPRRMLLGFMLSSYVLSMWIMNTATVTMLLPAVLAVVQQIEERIGKPTELVVPFLLGLAFASSIGGMATLVGTAPNLVFADFFNERYTHLEITFATWFKFGLPISAVLFVICYATIRVVYRKVFTGEALPIDYCRDQYAALGKMKYEEVVVLVLFLLTIFLWFFMKDIDLGVLVIPGWTSLPFLAEHAAYIKESTVAMGIACVLYLWPARRSSGGLIRWSDVQRLPIGVVFLFGGGFALAKGFEVSGLSEWLGSGLSAAGALPPFLIVLIICLFMTFLTELTSNTASTQLMLPIMLAFTGTLVMAPELIYIPMVMSASCAFMLPVATPPNTIVFGSDRLTVPDMMRVGIWLNVIGAVVITIAAFTVLRWVL
jgi:sodium-dependent dicarboxylate transporter 2/3/5